MATVDGPIYCLWYNRGRFWRLVFRDSWSVTINYTATHCMQTGVTNIATILKNNTFVTNLSQLWIYAIFGSLVHTDNVFRYNNSFAPGMLQYSFIMFLMFSVALNREVTLKLLHFGNHVIWKNVFLWTDRGFNVCGFHSDFKIKILAILFVSSWDFYITFFK